MRIVDAHRIVGPVPGGVGAEATAGDVVSRLDHLGITAAAVTSSVGLWGDPGREEQLTFGRDDRLMPVPVVLPAVSGAGWPADVGDVVGAAPAMVRACPVRHRFAATGPLARRWWHELATAGVPLALDAAECGFERIAAVATQTPGLSILILSPGYRTLRELAELLDVHPNVVVETGTLVAAGAVEWLAGHAGAQRLVFGSGAPVWDDAGPRFLLDHLRLPAADIELIAAGSFDRIRGDGAA